MVKWIIVVMIPILLILGYLYTETSVNTVEEANMVEEKVKDSEPEKNENLEEADQLQDKIKNEEEMEEVEKREEELLASAVEMPDSMLFEALALSNSGVSVYEKNDKTSVVIGTLDFGDHVFVIEQTEGWFKISTTDLEGWVSNTEMQEIPYDSSKKLEVKNPDDVLVLINKQYRLPRDYIPSNLVIPDIAFVYEDKAERNHLREEAAKALEQLFKDSYSNGIKLKALSGYRSFATQKHIFPNYVLREGFQWANQFSAFPGESEHQTGLAMDVTSESVGYQLTQDFGKTEEGKWVAENAHKYGFIIRYPEGLEDITGYTYEPWHLRFVGHKHAANIYELDITLEEYIEEYLN
ncbi:D-alanyl-D-alanine carboxypeptidase family protein [Alkalihalobacillus sp. LMS39]|uniref:D-alanyl-D-alanine carboxypeptidase family protein n=1 Tax=Alkalihalobacillus sp. LMS39 TaxID=2924032 RepID=UPI001FB43FC1|nr:D-alanyl-D-alanine carboxypeptidase family protein [Alkalihalobacillus sp. LMS39]UOE94044.1 D-alanyl-D-alanine carboxypeptidase family protein [Alkalihalobacillus sp. LMS39]